MSMSNAEKLKFPYLVKILSNPNATLRPENTKNKNSFKGWGLLIKKVYFNINIFFFLLNC